MITRHLVTRAALVLLAELALTLAVAVLGAMAVMNVRLVWP